jgi:hypothetical protein
LSFALHGRFPCDSWTRQDGSREDKRDEAMTDMSSSKQQYQYMISRRRENPGLGKEMEWLSIRGCKEIAEKGNFGFYAGDQGYGISVWYYQYLQLKLQ